MVLAKRQWSGFCLTRLWAKSKCGQAQRRSLLSFRGAERRQSAINSTQWVGHQAQLFSWCVRPDLECSFRGLCLFLRLSMRQIWGASGIFEVVPMRLITHLLLTGCQNSSTQGNEMEIQQRLEWRPEQSWVSYDAQVGSLVSGLWKHTQPLIFHLLFRVHKSSEI